MMFERINRYTSQMDLPQQVALVTGGAKRVGRAIVERLADAGFDVAFTFHRSNPEETEQCVAALGRRALAIRADLTTPEIAVESIASKLLATFDRLDVLVNNASAFEPGSLPDNPVPLQSADSNYRSTPKGDERSEGARHALDLLRLTRKLNAIHVEAPLLLCQKFESLLRSSRGRVINMIDLLAERPTKRFLSYSASKAALANLTISLASAMAPEVTVNGISPGVVDWADGYSQEKKEKYLARVPLRRAGTPTDVAELVHFLVTAAPYVSGQIIRMDGGRGNT